MKSTRDTHQQKVRKGVLCDSIMEYCKATRPCFKQVELFGIEKVETLPADIRVVELFAGVGGFRIGLERASSRYKTVWNNQWEPSTKRQDASMVYCHRFGLEGHSNEDIATVPTEDIPSCDLLVGGFPCQDSSVATTLKRSGGIEGKKGVLWWQIYRIVREMPEKPSYLLFENVDRLLKSPASQRGRDFAIILASLSDLGYVVEWRVINAAEYGMPQRRRRTYMVAYRDDTALARSVNDEEEWVLASGTMALAFPVRAKDRSGLKCFRIEGALDRVSAEFNKGAEKYVEFFIKEEDLPKWKYLKGSKSEVRKSPEGFEYKYSEGGMAFPDSLDKPSRTIITGEGGSGPSRFKHVVLTPSGRYRRLAPIELERLNMFPDRHTEGVSDMRRAFLMGNALVTGIVEKIGIVLLHKHDVSQ